MSPGYRLPEMSSRNWRLCLVAAVIGLCLSVSEGMAVEKPTDLEVKAAFVLNFSLFATWEHLATASEELRIGFFETQIEAAKAFVKVLDGKVVDRRPVRLIGMKNPEQIEECHIVYFANNEMPRLAEILERASQNEILTVGETVEFLKIGGMLAFQVENNRVRFLANPSQARKAGIQLSAKLLRLASLVMP
ncbi:MAG TPA: YfiR family protein [Candidatus Ozemobacteraceae bacterium]|nr:YfiR family protein [Candidatus Ozemobacteraceae bacterium]